MINIIQVANNADMIINGYAFTHKDSFIHILNLNNPSQAVTFNRLNF